MLKALAALPQTPSLTSVVRKMSSSPVFPKFVSVEGADIHSRSKPDGFRFSLVSYNIWLRWKSRSSSILEVIKNLGADFFCLQEVDEFDSFYKKHAGTRIFFYLYEEKWSEA
ncbi:Endonuclease/exonuclease/phosphatase superfamily [Sesbania bispinosa]|nr:Endonuclease/exonuclease/phosphatase superfamily [Sesbania bispinosa]